MSVSAAGVIVLVTFVLSLNDAAKIEPEVAANVTVAIEGGGPHGKLVVTVNGKAGGIHMRSPSNAIAIVICLELGWNTTTAHLTASEHDYLSGTRNWFVVLDDVYCTGNESRLADCQYDADPAHMRPSRVGVDCSPGLTVKQSSDNGYGLLGVFVNGVGGYVCSDRATDAIAKVVCREQGWNDTSTSHVRKYRLVTYRLSMVMANLYCAGDEDKLSDCTFTTHSSCESHPLGIYCQHVVPTIEGGGPKGKLVVTVDGRTEHICARHANDYLARVVCRQLGWNTTLAEVTEVPVPYAAMVSVRCNPYDDSLAKCDFYQYGRCNDDHAAGIDCSPDPRNVTFTVQGNGTDGRGTLHFRIEGKPVLVCRYGRARLAAVVCRELGWNTTRARSTSHYGRSDLPVYDLSCRGDESSVSFCTYSQADYCNREHLEMDINCSPEPTVTVSMQGGNRKGEVIATVNGQAGVVCKQRKKQFTRGIAQVACREMGLATKTPFMRKLVKATNYSYVIEDIRCQGSENRWDDCDLVLGNTCPTGEHFGVTCPRLSSKTNTFEIEGGGPKGRLLATIDDKTGTVCYGEFTERSQFHYHYGAIIACRELGWNTPRARVKELRPPTNWTNVFTYHYCSGSELSLVDCREYSYCLKDGNFADCCPDGQHVGLDCSLVPAAAIEGGGIRGRLVATIDGLTGRVCSQDGHEALATVVCRELGWNTSRISKVLKSPTLPVVVDDVYCIGNESKLADCKFITGKECEDRWDFEINCSPVPANVTVAIEGGGHKGRLIATIDGKTGSVCRHGATHDLAKVVCRELGRKTNIARIATVWTPSTLPIVMNMVHCTGNEAGLADCQFNTSHTCSHIEDVGIECPPDPFESCKENPCQNGGTCIKDCAGDFHCVCPPGVAGSTCNVFDSCSLSYYNKLATFAGETAYVSAPCAYDLVSMQCGDYHVKVKGKSKTDCVKKRCLDANETHVISSVDISVKSDDVTWEGKLRFDKFKVKHTVTGDESLVSMHHNRSVRTTVLVTSNNALSLTMSRDEGFKVTCANMTSSAEYPTSLCGAGKSGSVMIKDRSKELNFTETFKTLAFDVLTNANIEQTYQCKNVTAILLGVCQDRIEAIQKCSRCFSDPSRTKVRCLRKCLTEKGDCEKSP